MSHQKPDQGKNKFIEINSLYDNLRIKNCVKGTM